MNKFSTDTTVIELEKMMETAIAQRNNLLNTVPELKPLQQLIETSISKAGSLNEKLAGLVTARADFCENRMA